MKQQSNSRRWQYWSHLSLSQHDGSVDTRCFGNQEGFITNVLMTCLICIGMASGGCGTRSNSRPHIPEHFCITPKWNLLQTHHGNSPRSCLLFRNARRSSRLRRPPQPRHNLHHAPDWASFTHPECPLHGRPILGRNSCGGGHPRHDRWTNSHNLPHGRVSVAPVAGFNHIIRIRPWPGLLRRGRVYVHHVVRGLRCGVWLPERCGDISRCVPVCDRERVRVFGSDLPRLRVHRANEPGEVHRPGRRLP